MDDSVDFDAFFTRNYVPVVRTLWSYCGDRAVAEEAAQEAFVRASCQWRQVSAMTAPTAWLYRVARNEVNGHFRRLRARRRAIARHASAVAEEAADIDRAVSVRMAMRQLPERQRAVLALHYLADLPVAEIATVLDAPTGTIKSLLAR
ncbi:MAG: sigma-70 family RNA polymerase sigma factor, partial [Mycobacteriales bacterium]